MIFHTTIKLYHVNTALLLLYYYCTFCYLFAFAAALPGVYYLITREPLQYHRVEVDRLQQPVLPPHEDGNRALRNVRGELHNAGLTAKAAGLHKTIM